MHIWHTSGVGRAVNCKTETEKNPHQTETETEKKNCTKPKPQPKKRKKGKPHQTGKKTAPNRNVRCGFGFGGLETNRTKKTDNIIIINIYNKNILFSIYEKIN